MRLSELASLYDGHIDVHWRTFPLITAPNPEQPTRLSTEKTREGRQRALAEEPRAKFELPVVGTPLPTTSIAALTAAKAAERQGAAAFAAFHHQVFETHFRDNADISRADVLRQIADRSGLDLKRFDDDCAGGEAYRDVLHDYAEAVAWFGVSAIPTVVFNEKISLVGAVPVDQYRLLIDWILAGQPGGVIPLDFSETAAGRSER